MKRFILLTFLLTVLASPVFSFIINKGDALAVLSRPKRANSKGEEYRKRSCLERECASEYCDQEEYDEIFENHIKGYRKMGEYKQRLFESYRKCKPSGGRKQDVDHTGGCMKKAFKTDLEGNQTPNSQKPNSIYDTQLKVNSKIPSDSQTRD